MEDLRNLGLTQTDAETSTAMEAKDPGHRPHKTDQAMEK